MLDHLTSLARYDAWATSRLLDALEALPDGAYAEPGCSGHGSIQATLAHLLHAQRGWTAWLDGSQTMREAYARRLEPAEIPTPAAARALWCEIDARTRALVEGLDAERLEEGWELPTPAGPVTLPLWQLLLHLLTHGTHTRAQIVAAVRRAGEVPPGVDYLWFVLGR